MYVVCGINSIQGLSLITYGLLETLKGRESYWGKWYNYYLIAPDPALVIEKRERMKKNAVIIGRPRL